MTMTEGSQGENVLYTMEGQALYVPTEHSERYLQQLHDVTSGFEGRSRDIVELGRQLGLSADESLSVAHYLVNARLATTWWPDGIGITRRGIDLVSSTAVRLSDLVGDKE